MSQGRSLILTASVGCGHTRAAQAVQRGLQLAQPGARRDPLPVVDALEHTTAPFRTAYRDGYLALVRHAPSLVGSLYERSDRRPPGRFRRLVQLALGARGIARMLEEARPELVVCTHFLGAGVTAHLRRTGRLDAHFAVVVTDVDAHAIWLAEPCDRYFVAGETARRKLMSLGVDDRRITMSGIPIDPAFRSVPDRALARRQASIAEDEPVVMVSGGGFGVGPLGTIVQALVGQRRRMTVVVIAGRNRVAEAELRSIASNNPADHPTRLVPFGFTSAIREWMAASDLLIGKPGGLTSTEALACGLPLVIVSPVPGQEDRNADHLLELGVAVRCRDLASVGWKVAQLLDDPIRLADMRKRALAAARPEAAETIARELVAFSAAPAAQFALPWSPLPA